MQNTRQFKRVYERAQGILETTFGLQLQELPSKVGLDQEAAEVKKIKKASNGEDELRGVRKAAIGRKRGELLSYLSILRIDNSTTRVALGSKTYMLRSILDARLIELANTPDAEILEEEGGFSFSSGNFFGDGQTNDGNLIDADDDWDNDVEQHPRIHGSILSWTQNDQLGALGVLYVILALILVNGRVVQERMSCKLLSACRA